MTGKLRCEARRAWLGALGCAAVVLAAAAPARADPDADDARAASPSAEADALFERGKEQLRAGDWPAACASFRQSFERDASVSTAVKLARCHEHDGRAASALAEYRRALELNERLPQTPERRRELETVIRRAVAELGPTIPHVRLVFSPRPEQLTVLLDGKPVLSDELDAALPLDVGEHEVEATAPGFRSERVRVEVSRGEARQLEIAMARVTRGQSPPAVGSANSPSAPPPPRDTEPSAPGAASSPRKTLGIAIGTAGVVTLGGAAYFGIKTRMLLSEAKSDCDFEIDECGQEGMRLVGRARDAQTAALVLSGVGAGLATLGVVLFVTAPGATASDGPRDVRVSVGPTGVDLRGSF